MYDPKGKYILENGEFLLIADSTSVSQQALRKEFNAFVKGKPYLKNRVKHIKNYEKKLYYVKVWFLTELNDLSKLKNHEKRGFKKYHLDHRFPISEGFKKKIPPEVIAHMDNIQFIHFKLNMRKRDSVTEEAELIIKKLMKKNLD